MSNSRPFMFYITISNGLLKDGHRKRMGEAVLEFMWLIDRVTKVDDDGYGWILGGKPIKLEELATDLGVHRDTVSANLTRLEENGYIEKTRTPYGLSIKVVKAKKRFGANTESASEKRRI
jgi:DNA-binding transcriptional ArsR family regulator